MRKLFVDPTVNNGDFIIALKIMQGNLNPDTQKDFINQMLHATFLCPAIFDPDPDINPEGVAVMDEGAKVMLSSLANTKKEMFLVAYTDAKEAKEHKQAENQHTVACTYMDFCTMVLQENSPYAGFVINPFSENIVVSKEIMQNINKNIRLKKQVEIPREDGRRRN